MIRESVTIAECIELLNSAVEADPSALTALTCLRVCCNQRLAGHPSIQVGFGEGSASGFMQVGLLGILNGLFGADGPEAGPYEGHGPICAVLDQGCIARFEDARKLRTLQPAVAPEQSTSPSQASPEVPDA